MISRSCRSKVHNLTWLVRLCDLLRRRCKWLSAISKTLAGLGNADLQRGSVISWTWELAYSPKTGSPFGQDLPLVSLRPSCPNLFRPQPNTAPEMVRAKLCAPPTDIWANGIPCRDWIICGVEMLCPHIPNPSCPHWFWPQEKTWPPVKENGCNTASLNERKLDGLRQQINYARIIRPCSPLDSAWECQNPQATWAIWTSDNDLMFLPFGGERNKNHHWVVIF